MYSRILKSCTGWSDRKAIVVEDGRFMNYKDLLCKFQSLGSILFQLVNNTSISDNILPQELPNTPLISLVMNRDMGIVISMLAVNYAGCAYVPVDPAFPSERKSYIFSHSKCSILLVDEENFEILSKSVTMPSICIVLNGKTGEIIQILKYSQVSSIGANITSSLKATECVIPHADDQLMYVLYTSGSTGKPKGVMVYERGVVNVTEHYVKELYLDKDSVVMGLTTLCFDISMLEVFMPLISGGCLILASSSTQKDPFRIIELLESFEVSVFQATPTTYEMMFATGWTGSPTVHFLVGGEAFRSSLIPLAKCCLSLHNVYGPTETSIWSSSFAINSEISDYMKSMNITGVPIGVPIQETFFYLVSETSSAANPEIVTNGEGELWIGGTGVARGYIYAKEITAEKFLKNVFDFGVVYRTGDIVRKLSDGNYLFVRRLDDQVKIDGFRIELEEIEAVYRNSGLVDQVVALVRNNTLILYVKPLRSNWVEASDGKVSMVSADVTDMHSYAASRLTYYMIPKYTVFVGEFAKTPNGKLDKKALPDPEGFQIQSLVALNSLPLSFESTQITVSEIIMDVVEQFKGIRPSINASIGSFGLDSLSSVMIIKLISTRLNGVKLVVKDVFAAGVTVKSLSIALYDKLSDETKLELRIQAAFAEDVEGNDTVIVEPDTFGDIIASNIAMFEGLRGVFVFMVLWGHWAPSEYISGAENVDTTLFIILSGFATAIQTRQVPQYEKGNDGLLILQSPKPFHFWGFLQSRAIGIYPILWLALILNIPGGFIKFRDDYHGNRGIVGSNALCAILYVTGLNIYDAQCWTRGPDVLYASIILNCFVWFAVVMWLRGRYIRNSNLEQWYRGIKNDIKTTYDSVFVGQMNGSEYQSLRTLYSVFNLFHGAWVWPFVAKSMLVMVVCCVAMTYFSSMVFSNRLVQLLPYFGIGYVFAIYTELLLSKINSATAVNNFDGASIDNSKQILFGGIRIRLDSMVWRYFPDCIALTVALIMITTPTYSITSSEANKWIEWTIVPLLLGFYLLSQNVQLPNSANFTRRLLEFKPLTMLGYCSYTVYLLQNVMLLYYSPLIIRYPGFHYAPHEDLDNRAPFKSLPIAVRFGVMSVFLVVCYFIQWFYQDGVVTYMLSLIYNHHSHRVAAGTKESLSNVKTKESKC